MKCSYLLMPSTNVPRLHNYTAARLPTATIPSRSPSCLQHILFHAIFLRTGHLTQTPPIQATVKPKRGMASSQTLKWESYLSFLMWPYHPGRPSWSYLCDMQPTELHWITGRSDRYSVWVCRFDRYFVWVWVRTVTWPFLQHLILWSHVCADFPWLYAMILRTLQGLRQRLHSSWNGMTG